MFFKKLELVGFKSFPDKVCIEFGKGLTGIVGPNGCGKSNIADAIRWVLGEQSVKSLRGKSMEEMIFSGTETRRASGMAEVSLTIDNSDAQLPIEFSEVVITRRLFRSGESQYLLNGRPCRLRDLQEILADSGIGVSHYSVIGQGSIEEVLSAKPEERRQLLEEAAGIAKYRMRRREAQRHLQTTEENLLRLGDHIAELERQRRSLRRQAGAARQHERLQARIRAIRKELLLSQYVAERGQLAKEESLVSERRAKMEQAQVAAAAVESELEQVKLEAVEAERPRAHPVLYPRRAFCEASPMAISGRTSYRRV